MFCMHCGTQLPDDACFCASCGKPVQAAAPAPTAATAPASTTAPPASSVPASVAAAAGQGAGLDAYLERVAQRLGMRPQYVPEVGAHLFVTQRFSMALANIHQYFFIIWDDAAGYPEMQAYAARCADWALNNYQGLPRGLQKGIAIYAVLCQHPVNLSCVQLVKQTPKKHLGAFELPVVVDPVDHRIECLEKTPVWGFAMWNGIKKTAAETLGV